MDRAKISEKQAIVLFIGGLEVNPHLITHRNTVSSTLIIPSPSQTGLLPILSLQITLTHRICNLPIQ